jgi:hypothetical protein
MGRAIIWTEWVLLTRGQNGFRPQRAAPGQNGFCSQPELTSMMNSQSLKLSKIYVERGYFTCEAVIGHDGRDPPDERITTLTSLPWTFDPPAPLP